MDHAAAVELRQEPDLRAVRGNDVAGVGGAGADEGRGRGHGQSSGQRERPQPLTKYQSESKLPTPITSARNMRCGRRRAMRAPAKPPSDGTRQHGERRRPDHDALEHEQDDGDAVDQGGKAVLEGVGDPQVLEPGERQAGQQHDPEAGAEIAAIDGAEGEHEQRAGRQPQPGRAVAAAPRAQPGEEAWAEGEEERGAEQEPGHEGEEGGVGGDQEEDGPAQAAGDAEPAQRSQEAAHVGEVAPLCPGGGEAGRAPGPWRWRRWPPPAGSRPPAWPGR